MKYLNTYNESIKQFLKPKSEEDILKSLENLSDEEKFEKSCEFGMTSIVKDLIDNGFDPSIDNNYGIRIASENGHLEVVKELLKDKRVDPSVSDNHSIYSTSYSGHLDIVKLLLKDKRVDPSDDNNISLYWSFRNGHLGVVKELLKDKRVLNKLSEDDLIKYKKQVEGLNESIRDFLKPKSEQDILKSLENLSDEQKFKKSCRYGIISVVKNMISNGLDPSCWDNYGIRIASNNGHLDVVKVLLKDERVDPSEYDNIAIRFTSENGHLDVVKELLKDKRVDPSDFNNDAIKMSSENNHLGVIKELLKDKRVLNKLSEDDLIKYKKQVENKSNY